MNIATSESIQSSEVISMNTRPTRWWQWVLLYPALFVSIFASFPTYIETFQSMKIGVPYGESKAAIIQNDMWKENLSCTSGPLDPFITANNTKVDTTICDSGDVLVKIFTPEGENHYQWVDVDSVVMQTAFNLDIIDLDIIGKAYAYADGNAKKEVIHQSGEAVLCQKYLDSGRLLRRVSIPGQGCFDEIVNTFTGHVESKRPASCDSQCE